MGRGKQKRQKYLAAGLAVLLILGVVDYVRSQNMVQFAYSHFQACLLEYDQALNEYQETQDPMYLDSAESAVQHVKYMDSGFLKNISISEPLYRKRRTTLSDYLRLLSDYTKWMKQNTEKGLDMGEAVKLLYEGNQEIEELLVEESMDYNQIGGKTQKEVLERIGQMTEMIRNDME